MLVAGGVLSTGIVMYGPLSVVVIPELTMRRLQGQHLEQVEQELGTPLHRWGRDDFQCLPSYACRRKAPPEGPVLFYARGFFGYYLYFDEAGVLTEVETNSS